MQLFRICVLLAVCSHALAQNASVGPPLMETVKVRIEGTELDKRLLLDRLNINGPDHKMKFELADQEFAYRILFSTDQETAVHNTRWWYGSSGGTYNTSSARADVYDAQGNGLFKFIRRLRVTDPGATNAVAKEIIKRIRKLRGN